MQHCLKNLLIGLFGVLLLSSCKKDKPNKNEDPQEYKITLTKAANANSEWKLSIDAAEANRAGVWVDLNNNGTRDNGETVTKFGFNIASEISFPLGASKTITIYGVVTGLICRDNQLTAVDVSKNTVLKNFSCGFNQLTALDISKNTALERLQCGFNQLAVLDVSKNTMLQFLECNDNLFTTLDLSKNTALEYLGTSYNKRLTALDVSKNTALKILYCNDHRLTVLDVSKNTALEQLECAINQLKTLDLSKNTALKRLSCDRNSLTELDVSKNTALTDLECTENQLRTLNLSNNKAITTISMFRNLISGTNMQQFLNNLPARTTAPVIYQQGYVELLYPPDGNSRPGATDLAAARAKNWRFYEKMVGGGEREIL